MLWQLRYEIVHSSGRMFDKRESMNFVRQTKLLKVVIESDSHDYRSFIRWRSRYWAGLWAVFEPRTWFFTQARDLPPPKVWDTSLKMLGHTQSLTDRLSYNTFNQNLGAAWLPISQLILVDPKIKVT